MLIFVSRVEEELIGKSGIELVEDDEVISMIQELRQCIINDKKTEALFLCDKLLAFHGEQGIEQLSADQVREIINEDIKGMSIISLN